MAYRCRKCGMVYEGEKGFQRAFATGLCLNGDYHEWAYFESALDKQNKLLEKQNELLAEQINFQASERTNKEENEKLKRERIVNEAFAEVYEGAVEKYANLILDYYGWPSSMYFMGYMIFDDFNIITDLYPRQQQAFSRRHDVIWVFCRDINCRKEPENNLMTHTEILNQCERITQYYGIKNEKERDTELLYEYLDAFRETRLFKSFQEIINQNKGDDHFSYSAIHNMAQDYSNFCRSFYPKKYCEYLDHIMMEKDGKEEYNKFLKEYNAKKTSSKVLGGVIIGIVLFLVIRCTVYNIAGV